MIVLFDYDSLVYSAVSHIADTDDVRGWFNEGRSKDWIREEITVLTINKLSQMSGKVFIDIEETGIEITSIEYFLTNDVDSYRRSIYPEYKANRTSDRKYDLSDPSERVKSLNAWKTKNFKKIVNRVRKRLLKMDFAACHPVWEADDLIADRAREIGDPHFITVSMDKDLKQIPGLFYDFYREKVFHDYCEFPRNPEHDEKGAPVLDEYGIQKKRYRGLSVMTENESNKFFWGQMITGDSGDNIKGAAGFGATKVDGILFCDPKDYPFSVLETYKLAEIKSLKSQLNKRDPYFKKINFDRFQSMIESGQYVVDQQTIDEDAKNKFDLNFQLLWLGINNRKKYK